MLSLSQTIGLLQRFMPHRRVDEWLASDRQYSPVIPFETLGGEIFYREDDVLRFVRTLNDSIPMRAEHDRRGHSERREIVSDRRQAMDRRDRRRAHRNDLDRRFGVRVDRRGDLDRRIRGWVDRRSVLDRRESIVVNELEVELVG